jgi:hypothetical protein
MNWRRHGSSYRSEDGQYEVRSSYDAGSFAWRGRHIESDRLIKSSADRVYVQMSCERHALAAIAEGT